MIDAPQLALASASLVVSVVSSLTMGVLVLVRNPYRLTHRMFAALALNLALWALGVFMIVHSHQEGAARFWVVATFAVSSLLPATFYHFIALFPRQRIEGSRAVLTLLYLGAAAVSLGTATPWYLAGLEVTPAGPPTVRYGPVFFAFSGLVLVSMGFALANLLRKRTTSTGIQRRQVENLIFSVFASMGLATTTNVLAPVFGIGSLELYGPGFVTVLMAGLAYAMVRYQLLDIRGLVSRTTVYALATSFVVATFLGTVSLAHWFVTSTGGVAPQLLTTGLAALVVVLLLQPMRERLQLVADRAILYRRYDARALIGRINRMATRFVDLPEMLSEVSRALRQTIGVRSMCVYLVSERDPEAINVAYSTHEPAIGHTDINHAFLVQYVRDHPDVLSLEELLHGRPSTARTTLATHLAAMDAFLLLPLTTSTGLIGLATLGEKTSRDVYTAEDVKVLEAVAGALSGAIENNRLYRKIGDLNLHLQRIMSSMRGGVVAIDEKANVTTANEEAREILGGIEIGQPMQGLHPRLVRLLRHTVEQRRGIADVEATLVGPDGQHVPVAMSSSCFLSADGEVEGAMVLIVNMTTIKRLESNVQRADRLTSIGTMAAGMAHEIKNPLQSIKTFTQLLLDRFGDEDFRRTFSEVVPPEVQRIDTIVSRLLDFARPRPVRFAPKDVCATVRDVIALTENQLRKASIRVRTIFPAHVQPVVADDQQLHQVFLNLVLNAIDAMDEMPHRDLTISVEYCHAHLAQGRDKEALLDVPCVRVAVADTGCGIPEKHIGQLFNPFFTTKDHGCGLGLAVVHGLVKEHGGEIDVASHAGEGTVFTVTLPMAGKPDRIERVGT